MMLAWLMSPDIAVSGNYYVAYTTMHLHFQGIHACSEAVSVRQEEDPESKRQKDMASNQLEKAKKSGHIHHT